MSTESQNEKERNEMIVKRIDFEHGSIPSNILNAAIPMLVAQLLSLLYNIIDRIYIARIPHIGTTALGAVGLCFPIIVIITAFSNLFGSGGAPLFSIRRGENNSRKASEIMNTSYTMVCGGAIVLMVIGFLFARPILRLFGASESALVYAYPYLMIYLLGYTAVHDLHRYEFVYQRAGICHDWHDIRCHRRGGKLHSRSGFHLRLFAWNPGCCNCNRDFPDTLRCICPLFSEKTIGA